MPAIQAAENNRAKVAKIRCAADDKPLIMAVTKTKGSQMNDKNSVSWLKTSNRGFALRGRFLRGVIIESTSVCSLVRVDSVENKKDLNEIGECFYIPNNKLIRII